MASVAKIAEEIVGREGGFVNDPSDPGGATKHGVTIHTAKRLGLDLDRDGDVDTDDVKLITEPQAVGIFLEHYYTKPRISQLPEIIQPSVFDMYVNAGSNAVKILQRLFRDMGYDIGVDGGIGPQTTRIAYQAFDEAGDRLADMYGIARRNYYFAIADGRPASRKYVVRTNGGKAGWIKRAEEFITPEYHMTDGQFKARIASWG